MHLDQFRISNHLVSAMGDEEEGVTVPSRTLLLQVVNAIMFDESGNNDE